MTPAPKHAAERLYLTPWPNRKRELIALAMDEAGGHVRPEFARWVRNGRKS